MKKKYVVFFLGLAGVFGLISCGESGSEKTVPESIYRNSSSLRRSPLGKWRYANHQFFEFTGHEKGGTWEFYFDFGQGKQVQFAGTWKVFHFQDEKSSGLLRLDYEWIGLGNPQLLDPKTGMPIHRLYPVKRWQMIEFYADDQYFGMNVYFKKEDSPGLFGTWTHVNYDWFDDFYFWSESPLWMEQKKFEEQILAKIDEAADREFFKDSYSLNLKTYYRKPGLHEDAISRLSSIMEGVRDRGGYRGEWFHTPLSSIPGYEPYYVNRRGDLTFMPDGGILYRSEGGYFKSDSGETVSGLPVLSMPKKTEEIETARYDVWENPVYDDQGIEAGSEASMKFYESSNPMLIWDWEFKAIILKDRHILITFPFQRVRE